MPSSRVPLTLDPDLGLLVGTLRPRSHTSALPSSTCSRTSASAVPVTAVPAASSSTWAGPLQVAVVPAVGTTLPRRSAATTLGVAAEVRLAIARQVRGVVSGAGTPFACHCRRSRNLSGLPALLRVRLLSRRMNLFGSVLLWRLRLRFLRRFLLGLCASVCSCGGRVGRSCLASHCVLGLSMSSA